MPRITPRCTIEHALEIFVRGFSAERSRTHPYETFRVGQIWVLRDAPRKNAKDYRKEEWIAYGVDPAKVDFAARRSGAGDLPPLKVPPATRRFFVCAVAAANDSSDELKAAYKALGYRLLTTEALFAHPLAKLPRSAGSKAAAADNVRIEQVTTAELAQHFGKATRTRPIPAEDLTAGAAFRQYVALESEQSGSEKIVGWVRSVDAGDSTWVSNLHVLESHRRRGIGTLLMTRLLKDDRARRFQASVLLATHTGALLYPRLGYQHLGQLFIFAPRK